MNYIIIKSGILKAYNFDDEFIQSNNDLFNQFVNIWDELYSGSCCVWGACEKNKGNKRKPLCKYLASNCLPTLSSPGKE